MVFRAGKRRWVLVWVTVGAVLAGCAAASTPTGSPMMDGGATATAGDQSIAGSPMMGGIAPLGAPMMLRAAPTSVPAGQVSLAVSNMGWRTHELVILPLAAGTPDGVRTPGPDGKVDEAGSLGEASNNCAEGAGDGITAGGVGWTTVTLTPGRYELVCNLQNHYADGMHQAFVVT